MIFIPEDPEILAKIQQWLLLCEAIAV